MTYVERAADYRLVQRHYAELGKRVHQRIVSKQIVAEEACEILSEITTEILAEALAMTFKGMTPEAAERAY